VDFLAPNFAADDETVDPVPLQLFIKPMNEPAAAFDADRLKQVVAGLHSQVYHGEPGEMLFDRTLPPDCQPRLRPAKLAGVAKPTAV
jgi:hypothetical protein